MNTIIPSIIHSSQTGFIRGRYIGENIRSTFECIQYLNEKKKPGMLLFADYEKSIW